MCFPGYTHVWEHYPDWQKRSDDVYKHVQVGTMASYLPAHPPHTKSHTVGQPATDCEEHVHVAEPPQDRPQASKTLEVPGLLHLKPVKISVFDRVKK